jgi:hypothetical protein
VQAKRFVVVELSGFALMVDRRDTEVALVHYGHVHVHLAVIGKAFADGMYQR